MKDGPHVLACMRLSDMPDPPAASLKGRCKICGFQVWIALSSPRKDKLIYCTHCTFDEMKLQQESGEECEVLPPTAKQLKDVASWRRRKQ